MNGWRIVDQEAQVAHMAQNHHLLGTITINQLKMEAVDVVVVVAVVLAVRKFTKILTDRLRWNIQPGGGSEHLSIPRLGYQSIASDHTRSILPSPTPLLYSSTSRLLLVVYFHTSTPGASASTSEFERQITVRHHVLLLSQHEPVTMDDALVAEQAADIIPIKVFQSQILQLFPWRQRLLHWLSPSHYRSLRVQPASAHTT